uniref:NADH-ubiquinone oxidoreductase chain 6 n=1 Tax=Amphigerontia montivaga TaxID=2051644 RepID=A0A343QCE5_9NEOP|nr:NADH dehydrogenase subunit 6 [Amphigerontia montivaga]ATU07092.1 NADH dehydrogenase subunit 6 [Amphigerontia montivaga]
MIWMFMLLAIIFSMLFFMVWNPLTLGLILIFQTILLSIFVGLLTPSFWFLYLLMLVFIGGMLVLFVYVTSIFPNEKFSFSQYSYIFLLSLGSLLILTLYFMNNLFMMNPNMNYLDLLLMNKPHHLMSSTTKIFNSQNNFLLIFLVNYLFYCMIVVIKITNFYSGPLRKMQ